MAAGQPEPSPDHETSGLKQELASFLKETADHVKIRGELFAIEAKEAAGIYSRPLGLAVVGILLVLVAYLLLLAGAIGILGQLISGSGVSFSNWIGAAWILAAGHLIPGICLLKKSKAMGPKATVFEYTRGEFKKDQQWLSKTKKP